MSSPTIGVQSIRRAFAVLRALADGPLGVSEVAVASRIPKSHGRAAPRRPGRRGRRRAGPGRARATASARTSWRSPPASARRGTSSPSRARRSSTSSAELGEAAGVSIRDGWTVQYVDQVEPPNPNPVQVRDWTGTRIPLHAVSSGQVFLAQLPAPVLARYLAEPLEASRRGRSPTRARCSSGCATSGATATPGFATSTSVGISSVAAPDRGRARRDRRGRARPRAVVPLPAPPARRSAIAAAVRTAAARIGARLRAGS